MELFKYTSTCHYLPSLGSSAMGRKTCNLAQTWLYILIQSSEFLWLLLGFIIYAWPASSPKPSHHPLPSPHHLAQFSHLISNLNVKWSLSICALLSTLIKTKKDKRVSCPRPVCTKKGPCQLTYSIRVLSGWTSKILRLSLPNEKHHFPLLIITASAKLTAFPYANLTPRLNLFIIRGSHVFAFKIYRVVNVFHRAAKAGFTPSNN